MQLPAEALAAERAAAASEARERLRSVGGHAHGCAACESAGSCGAHVPGAAPAAISDAAAPFVSDAAVSTDLPEGVYVNAEGMYTTNPDRPDLATYARVTLARDGEAVPQVHFYGTEAPPSPATDNLEFDAYELPNFALPTEEKLHRLQPFFDMAARVSEALGEASAFASSFDELRVAADEAVGPYRGANGRYRAAKTSMPPQAARGTLALASMYENTDIMLKLREGFAAPPLPTLHLEFDGALDKAVEGKIRSFIYYL